MTRDPLLDPDCYPPGSTAEAFCRLGDAWSALWFEILQPLPGLIDRVTRAVRAIGRLANRSEP